MALLPACGRRATASHRVAERVVSLSPSTTEAVFALGAGPKLVGRSRYCDYPPEVARLPSVGGYVDPSFEAIAALSPDLVVGARGPSGRGLYDRLNARGVITYFPPTDTWNDIDEMLRGIAERLGSAAAGAQLVRAIARKRDAIVTRLRDVSHPRTLLVFGIRPIVAAGTRGFAGEMLTLAGAINAVTSNAGYPTLGIEEVLALDPDVVIDATGSANHDGEGFAPDLPGWRQLRATKQGKLLRIRDERVLRPGPRIAEGLNVLARALHPDLDLPP